MNTFAAERADAIYRIGPETLLASTSLVVVGTVGALTREITATTEGEPLPISWTAHGQLSNLRTIKGPLQTTKATIVRKEQAMFAIGQLDEPGWTQMYGDLVDGGSAVAFFDSAAEPGKASFIVPSGSGEQNLHHLLDQAARIALNTKKKERIVAEAHWLTQAATEAEKKAALRMLLKDQAPWQTVSSAIQATWTNSSSQLHQYFTGYAGFAIIEGAWSAEDERPVAFICRAFMEANERSSSGIMLQLKQLLVWSERKNASIAMAYIGKLITECYRQRLADRPLSTELKGHFDQLDPKYGLR